MNSAAGLPHQLTGRKLVSWFMFVIAAAMLSACTSTPALMHVRAELAPAGKLRVGLILSNQVLVTRDASSGELRGVTVLLAKALAAELGVPWEAVGYANPAALVQSFGRNEWDIAFLAYDPTRATDVDFSPPYMEVDNSYLVAPNSSITSVEAADRVGVTIAVPERSAPDLFLSRNLKAASLLRVPGGADAAIQAITSGKADAYAENAHMLSLYANRIPGARVLDGHYTVIRHAIALPKGRPLAAEYLKTFVTQARNDGTVASAILAAGLRRTHVPTE
jgi:polar amino acid transport system substrate-binding protein